MRHALAKKFCNNNKQKTLTKKKKKNHLLVDSAQVSVLPQCVEHLRCSLHHLHRVPTVEHTQTQDRSIIIYSCLRVSRVH